jgi:hypothetical protein
MQFDTLEDPADAIITEVHVSCIVIPIKIKLNVAKGSDTLRMNEDGIYHGARNSSLSG